MAEKLYTTGDIAKQLGMKLNDVCYRVRRLMEDGKIAPVVKAGSYNLFGKEVIKLVKDFNKGKK